MTWEDWSGLIRHYYAFTSLIDEQIGRLLDGLEASGALENTVVIFSADHGEALGDHGGTFNKGFTHFEETLKVPLIVRFPDGTGAGSVCRELVSSLDIYASILELAGAAQADQPVHGESFLPLARGEDADWRDHVVTEFHGLQDELFIQRTYRKGQLKYGYNSFLRDELYDLSRDPCEMTNRIDDPEYADDLRQLRDGLRDWMMTTGDQAVAGYSQLHCRG
jgi:arylsulfatase A-like enzyme